MSFFETLAECSIALAGFGAIHAVLRGGTGARAVYRAFCVVATGALVFLLSIVPAGLLSLTTLSEAATWRLSSVFGVAGASASVYVFFALNGRLSRMGFPPDTPAALRAGQAINLFAIAAMVSNLVGWPWATGAVVYGTGLVLLLVAGLNPLVASFLFPLVLALRGERAGGDEDEA